MLYAIRGFFEWLTDVIFTLLAGFGLVPQALPDAQQSFTAISDSEDIVVGECIDPDTGQAHLLIIPADKLSTHALVSGRTRSGKSRQVAALVLQKIARGEQVFLLDPHGSLFNLILEYCVAEGVFDDPAMREKLLFFDIPTAARRKRYPSFDILAKPLRPETIAEGMLDAIRRIYAELEAAPAFDSAVQFGSHLLAHHKLPITLLPKILDEKSSALRRLLLQDIENPQVGEYFTSHYDKANSPVWREAGAVQRRIHRLFATPELRIGLSHNGENNLGNFATFLEKGQSVFINLKLETDLSTKIWGALILIAIEQAILERLGHDAEEINPCTLVVDEFPLFVSKDETALNTFLQRTAGAGLSMWLLHQNLSNVPLVMRGALDNCALRFAFQIGGKEDAQYHVPYFFDFDPLRVKDAVQGQGESRVTFFSGSDQEGVHAKALMRLRKREAYVALPEGSSYKISSLDIPDIAKTLRGDERKQFRQAVEEVKEYYLSTLFRTAQVIEQALELRKLNAFWDQAQQASENNNAPSSSRNLKEEKSRARGPQRPMQQRNEQAAQAEPPQSVQPAQEESAAPIQPAPQKADDTIKGDAEPPANPPQPTTPDDEYLFGEPERP